MSRAARWQIDAQGWLPAARRVESPNFDARPSEVDIDLLVVHHISLPAGCFRGDAIERLFTNRLDPAAHPTFESLGGLRVSAHFLIRRHGTLVQFVSCDARAWHAGASCFLGRERCNDFSIGVELEGTGERSYTNAQYCRLEQLAAALARRYPLRWITGHEDIAPGRKLDPGPSFDWPRTLACVPLARPLGPQSRTDA